MSNPYRIVCGSSAPSTVPPAWRNAPTVHFEIGRAKNQIHVRLEHLSRRLLATLAPVAQDLIDVAAYVYTADQWVRRGGRREFEYGLKWRRQFRFEIPVVCLERWQNPDVIHELCRVLGFLSDDDYEFDFRQSVDRRPLEERYLFTLAESFDHESFQDVVLFSGGLDSLCGAVQEVIQGQRSVVLVSHRSVNKVYARQRDLAEAIGRSLLDARIRPLHVPVEVNKGKRLGRESTQRSRSFLFAAIAASVANVFNLNRVRFYENGITSLNLPVSPDVLGGRASRTTHPRVLAGFSTLLSHLFGRPFTVENPFRWKTKTDILAELKAAGYARFAALTGSCAQTWNRTERHPHCGRCSQCVDRRLTALAAGLDDTDDSPAGYESDVLTGERTGPELTLIERYYASSLRVSRIESPAQFLKMYPELARAFHVQGTSPAQTTREVLLMARRHADQILGTLVRGVARSADAIVRRSLHPHCLLALAGASHASPRSARPVPSHLPGSSPSGLRLDPDRFTVSWGHQTPLFLGNGREFQLLQRLARSPNRFFKLAELREDVWGNDSIELNTVQRTVSNLRSRLSKAGFVGVILDGSQKGHYRLRLEPTVDRIST